MARKSPRPRPVNPSVFNTESNPKEPEGLLTITFDADEPDFGLLDQERDFCREYIRDYNPVRAAMAVPFYRDENQSLVSSRAYNLLQQRRCKRYIAWLKHNYLGVSKAVEQIDPNRIIKERMAIAFSNIQDYFDFDEETGRLTMRNITKMPRDKVRAIKKIKYRTYKGGGTEVEFEMVDRESELDKLAKEVGLGDTLNQALNALKNLDFEIIETEFGFELVDLQRGKLVSPLSRGAEFN